VGIVFAGCLVGAVHGRVLPAVVVGLQLVLLYLGWRFVRAHERIPAALEASQNVEAEREPIDR